jgi:signal transduction histidine kinase
MTVGLDRREIDLAVADFRRNLILSLALLGAALVLAAWIQVSIGLRPLEIVRKRLEWVRSGMAPKLEGDFPSEVQPLAEEVNGLLDAQQRALERARHRASDLAHGLKTPITLIDSIIRDLRKSGNERAADDLEEQAQVIGRHVEHELARARLAHGRGGKGVPLRPSAERVIRAMTRLPRGEDIVWDNDLTDEAQMTIDEQDLVELLGNLIDNARKWSRGRVRVAAEDNRLLVEDDGPGVPEAERLRIVKRGQQLDEKMLGSGLGLAIVHDIAEMHGLGVAFTDSPLGGLRVSVSMGEERPNGQGG